MSFIQKVSFEEAHALLESTPEMLLFDVREEEEYITGHAVNAQLFTLADINKESAAALIESFDTPVMVYCRIGTRSQEAAEKLHQLGYRKIYNLGGLIGWPYGLE